MAVILLHGCDGYRLNICTNIASPRNGRHHCNCDDGSVTAQFYMSLSCVVNELFLFEMVHMFQFGLHS